MVFGVEDLGRPVADQIAELGVDHALIERGAVGDGSGLDITLHVNGERRQSGNTSQMLHPVANLVAICSRWVTLEPGDLIFTGTPGGVGSVRDPRRYLAEGEVITTRIEGLGELVNRCIAGG